MNTKRIGILSNQSTNMRILTATPKSSSQKSLQKKKSKNLIVLSLDIQLIFAFSDLRSSKVQTQYRMMVLKQLRLSNSDV